ncbi:MAG: sensor domain-containing diguanylate cyclase [Actinomycetota bacterium]
MTTGRWRFFGVAGAVAVAVLLLLPDGPADLWYHACAIVVLILLVGVLIADRAQVEAAWWLASGGLVLLVGRGALGYLDRSAAVDGIQVALLVTGCAAILLATLRLIALRTNLRDLDGVIDVLMLTSALTVVLWEFVARRYLGDGRPLGSPIAVVAFPIVQALVLSLSVRFMFWGTWRHVGGWLYFGATVAVFAGNVDYLVNSGEDRGVPSGVPGGLWLLGLLLFALAAAHRSRGELTRAALPALSRVPYARLALVGSALIAAPAIVFANAHEYAAGLIPAVGSLLLTVMIVGRLFRVVVEREGARAEIGARSEQQQALVRLGQRALAGSELARLFDEATIAVAATMKLDYSGVFEPAGAETLVLSAAVGWDLTSSSRSTVGTAEPFFGVPLVAGAPGYLDTEHHSHGIRASDLLIDSRAMCGVSVPIGTPAERYGVLAVASRSARRFSADDVTFLRAVANVLTAAIERTRTEDMVRQVALHDPLTGLPNRVLLLDRLESALSRANRHGARVAVMFVDLDDFKAVNDTFGHRAGDQLLVAVARRLEQALRSEDTLTRLAGDEFVVVCERIDAVETIAAIARRVVDTLREPFVLDDGTAQISGSVGIAVGAGRGDDVDQLLRDADTAMYRAKQAGKSRFELAAGDWTDAQRAS